MANIRAHARTRSDAEEPFQLRLLPRTSTQAWLNMVQPRPLWASAALVAGTITAGLALRMVPLGLPGPLVKHGGSVLWALMIFWVVSTACPRWSHIQSALVAIGVAFAVELFQLYHAPWLDAFRLTLPGTLLLGRVFSTLDLVAYALAISIGACADRRFRLAGSLT